jgi:hypothetical protein
MQRGDDRIQQSSHFIASCQHWSDVSLGRVAQLRRQSQLSFQF